MCVFVYESKTTTCRLHSLDDVVLGLQQEVAVVPPHVGEVHLGGGEDPVGLGVFSLQLLHHVEAVHHLALPPLHRLADAVHKLHLQESNTHTHTHAQLATRRP